MSPMRLDICHNKSYPVWTSFGPVKQMYGIPSYLRFRDSRCMMMVMMSSHTLCMPHAHYGWLKTVCMAHTLKHTVVQVVV